MCTPCPDNYITTLTGSKGCTLSTCTSLTDLFEAPTFETTLLSDGTDVTMSWKRKSGSKNDERTKWHVVEVSTSVQFTASSTLRVGRMISLEFTSIKINLTSIFSLHGGAESNHRTPHFLWDQIVYGRVRAGGDGGCTSEWSDSSSPWKTTRDCSEEKEYLMTNSTDPMLYTCEACPIGASCDGTWVTMHEVRKNFFIYFV